MTSRVAPATAPTRSPSTRAGVSVASTGGDYLRVDRDRFLAWRLSRRGRGSRRGGRGRPPARTGLSGRRRPPPPARRAAPNGRGPGRPAWKPSERANAPRSGSGSVMAWPIQEFCGRPLALPRDPLLVHHVVEVEGVVRDHDQQRQPVVGRGPDRGPAHQEVAVAEDGHRQAAAALERERGPDRHPRPRADARAAVQAQVVERVADVEVGPGPAQRQPDQAGGRAERVRASVGQSVAAAPRPRPCMKMSSPPGGSRPAPAPAVARPATRSAWPGRPIRAARAPAGRGRPGTVRSTGSRPEGVLGPAVVQRRVGRAGDDPGRRRVAVGGRGRRSSRPGRSSRG